MVDRIYQSIASMMSDVLLFAIILKTVSPFALQSSIYDTSFNSGGSNWNSGIVFQHKIVGHKCYVVEIFMLGI